MKRFGQAITGPLRLVSQPVALVIAALLLLGAWGLVTLIQASEAARDARGNLLLTANAIAGAVDAPFAHFAEQTQTVRPIDFDPTDRVAATARMLRLQSLLPGNSTVFMVDAGGRLLSASTPFTPDDANVAAAAWFRVALADASMSLGLQVLDHRWLGLPQGVVLTHTVRDATGNPVGLIGAVLPAGNLERLAIRGWLPPETRVEWLGMDNRSVLILPETVAAIPPTDGISDWASDMLAGLSRWLAGSLNWSATVPLQHLDASIVATVDGNAALRGRPLIGRSAALLGGYLFAVWLTCLVLARSVGPGTGQRAAAAPSEGFGSDWQCDLDAYGTITAVRGFAPGDLRERIGQKLVDALGTGSDAVTARQIEEALAGHTRVDGVIVPLQQDDAQERFHQVDIEPLQDGRFVCSGRDVTTRCRAEASAEAAARACQEAEAAAAAMVQDQERVLASLGHDIRTPLTTIMGIGALMLEGDLEREQRVWLERMRTSGEALLAMLNGLLELSTSEADRASLHVEPVDVASLVLEVTEVLAPQARDKGLELRVRCDDPLRGEWMLDPARLRQVLFNLVSNAVKFTSSGLVEVRAAAVGGDDPASLRFSISDSGPGIDPADRELIFERFRRGRDPASAARPGVGLGLALCRENAALMGGKLTLESTLGIGSEFSLVVPAERLAPKGRVAMFAGRTALIVGEESSALRAAGVQLDELGLILETAPDGFLGLALAERLDAQRGALDLVVLQGNLFSMPAEVFLLRLRATAFGRRASVVWIGDGAAGIDVDAVVPAPADPYQIAAAVRQLLGARASLDAFEPDAVVARGGRILIVEDDKTTQTLVSTALTRRGFAVFVAGNGEEGARLAGHDSFDAVLMDLQMPGVDGFGAVRRIRAMGGRMATMPIIAMTAFHGSKVRQRCIDAGFTAVTEKPVNLNRLEATLRRWTTDATPAVAQQNPDMLDYEADVSTPFLEEMVAVVGMERTRACVAEFLENATARCGRLEELLPGWESQAIIRNCQEVTGMAETCGAIALSEVLEELGDAVSRDDRDTAEMLVGRLEETVARLPAAMAACLEDLAQRWSNHPGRKAA